MDPYGYQFARFVGNEAVRYGTKRVADYAFDATTMYRRHGKAHRKMGPGFQDVAGRRDAGAGYQQLTYAKKSTCGRKLSKRRVAQLAAEAQLLTKIDRWQGLTSLSTAAGFYALSSYSDASSIFLPYYVFDLSALSQNITSNTGNIQYGQPMMRLTRRVAAGANQNTWAWALQTQDAGTGASSNQWAIERQPYFTSAANAPYEKALLNWADIRLVMTGATKYPSGVDVMIVKYVDDERVPPAYYYDGTSGQQTLYDTPSALDKAFGEYSRFWQTQVDNLSINPIQVRNQPTDAYGLKVIKSARFEFQPTMSTETDTIGHQKVFKMFYNMNKIHSYRYPQEIASADTLPATQQLDPTRYVADTTVNLCTVVPEHRAARTFLLIRGHTAASSNTAGDFPSFDLLVRRKMTII